MYYHNITPPNILINSNPRTADLCKKGIEDLILLEKADLVIVNSIKTKTDLSKHIKKNIHVVPPISSDMLFYKSLNQNFSYASTGLTLNFTGRIEPNKNIEQLIEIMAHLVSFNSEYKLVIVGKAENLNYLDALIRLADKNQISQAIRFKGFISLSDLIYEYNKSDVFITTSLHEGFCVPVHEMMSMGKASFVKKGSNAAEDFIYDSENTLLGENNYENAVKINRNLPLLLNNKEAIKRKSIEILKLTSDNNWKDLLKKI